MLSFQDLTKQTNNNNKSDMVKMYGWLGIGIGSGAICALVWAYTLIATIMAGLGLALGLLTLRTTDARFLGWFTIILSSSVLATASAFALWSQLLRP
jgi:hypothetical protein